MGKRLSVDEKIEREQKKLNKIVARRSILRHRDMQMSAKLVKMDKLVDAQAKKCSALRNAEYDRTHGR